jgi:hypothetical protein
METDMLTGVSGGYGIHVGGGWTSLPFVGDNPSNPLQGMMRVKGNNVEIYNNSSWTVVTSNVASVELTGVAQTAIEWAQKKMAEEKRLDELCEKYPGLRKARDNYETFLALVQSESVQESV